MSVLWSKENILRLLEMIKREEIKTKSGSSLCGGVISQSMEREGWFGMVAFVLPDRHYGKYIHYKICGKNKEAEKIFDKYAYDPLA